MSLYMISYPILVTPKCITISVVRNGSYYAVNNFILQLMYMMFVVAEISHSAAFVVPGNSRLQWNSAVANGSQCPHQQMVEYRN